MQYACMRLDGDRTVLVDAAEYIYLREQRPVADEPRADDGAIVWKLAYGAFLVPPGDDPDQALRELLSYRDCMFGWLTSLATCRLAAVRDIEIREAAEWVFRSGNEMIEVLVAVTDAGGNGEREFRDYLTGAAGLGAAKTRHACAACGREVLTRYEAGEISQDDFPGKAVRVKLDVERRRGYAPPNIIVDYAPAAPVP